MLVIGLTGGIGAGKTTVANLFANHGVPIIDADIIAREITAQHQPALAKIKEYFGETILQINGELDRKKLRQVIFADQTKRVWLENLLHPLIRDEIKTRIKTLSAPYCMAVIPLLLEVAPYPFIDRILVVDASEEQQLERVAARDQTQKEHIAPILKTQITREKRLQQADDTITNHGTLLDLESQVAALHQKYLALK